MVKKVPVTPKEYQLSKYFKTSSTGRNPLNKNGDVDHLNEDVSSESVAGAT